MSAFSHSIQRAKQRYDLEFTTFDLCVIRELILMGRAVVMGGGTDDRHIYLVRYREAIIKLVFDEKSKQVITILPASGGLRKQHKKSRGKVPRRNARRRKSGRTLRTYIDNWVEV